MLIISLSYPIYILEKLCFRSKIVQEKFMFWKKNVLLINVITRRSFPLSKEFITNLFNMCTIIWYMYKMYPIKTAA